MSSAPQPHCDERRKITRQLPSVSGLWAPYTHRDCTCNEFVAIRNRVVGAVPEPTEEGLKLLAAEARRVSKSLPTISPMTRESFVNHYSGRNKSRYQNAVDSLEREPLDLRKDSLVKAFVKAEKFAPSGKVNPDPRMIQARSPRYNVEVGRYLKVIEHHLYRLKSSKGLPLLGKGLTMAQRGTYLKEMWDTYREPVCVSYDGSRWDQHISREVLEIEHQVYLQSCPDEYFAALLKQQLNNRCITSRGWRYKTRGKRMSGDMNTALGNCLLMIIMVRAAMREIGVLHDLFDDGDDVLVIFEKEHLDRVQARIPGLFLSFGQEVKVENIATKFEDIEWCQAKPVLGPAGYQMVANWRKVLSQSAAGVRYWHEDKTRFDMGHSVGQCILAMYQGIPILQKYGERLCSQGKLNRDIFDSDWMFKLGYKRTGMTNLGNLGTTEVTAETRASFAAAFGIDEIEQHLIEEQLEHWSLGDGIVDVPLEVSQEWEWTYQPGTEPTDWVWTPPHQPTSTSNPNQPSPASTTTPECATVCGAIKPTENATSATGPCGATAIAEPTGSRRGSTENAPRRDSDSRGESAALPLLPKARRGQVGRKPKAAHCSSPSN